MNCQEAESVLTDFALDELDLGEREEVEAHRKSCASCDEAFREIQHTANLLSEGFQKEPVPILSEQERESIFKRNARTQTARWWKAGLAAGLILSAGWFAYQWRELENLPEQARISTKLIKEFSSTTVQFESAPAESSSLLSLGGPEKEIQIAPIPIVAEDDNEENEQPVFTANRYVAGRAVGGKISDHNESDSIGIGGSFESKPSPGLAAGPTTGAPTTGPGTGPIKVGEIKGVGAFGGRRNIAAKKSPQQTHGGTYRGPGDSLAPWGYREIPGTESYEGFPENPFLSAKENPLSTFSIDVDTASYSNMRRFINNGHLPPKDSVRVEEFLNYFSYDYQEVLQGAPLSVFVDSASCPWTEGHRLVRIALKAKDIPAEEKTKPCNLVFLIDVSGSMEPANKLPLLKSGMNLLLDKLSARDRVGIVVYANEARVVLPSTSCEKKEAIRAALDSLKAEGSTNGGAGIQMAYEMAASNWNPEGINRVILSTDGDFNVGITNQNELVDMIERKAKSGVFLSVLGFGVDNLKDSTLEKLSDKGNGNYAYIDTFQEARRALFTQLQNNLVTVAKDVKIQVEFNPAEVSAYRLLGYENRALAAKDFKDDKKDAGELGAGQSVTALYEIVPANEELSAAGVEELKYQKPVRKPRELSQEASSGELLTVKVRYKNPNAQESQQISVSARDSGKAFTEAGEDFRFASAVASFALILRESPNRGEASFERVQRLAEASRGEDESGYRSEFIHLIELARKIQPNK